MSYYHRACGLKTDGSITCWGNEDNSLVPDPSEGPFTAVTAAGIHTCGIRADSTAACWNRLDSYELPGDGYTAIAIAKHRALYSACGMHTDGTITCREDDITPSGRYTNIFASHGNTCGIRQTDGTIHCAGDTSSEVLYKADRLLDPPPGRFTQITTGGNHACALRTDQTIECWGANHRGQTGKPPTR
ncbi:MAG: RCC1 domain-containing protein [bacterium]|nr:RCC1 domain-containing protein [bacterium]